MLSECSANPSLLDCTPSSLFGGVIRAAQLGLVIGGPTGESYLLPFANTKKKVKEATLIIGYRGFLQLAHRSGMVRRITPRVVRKGDSFYVRYGSQQNILHEPIRNNAAEPTDYYVILETVTGGLDFEVATYDEMIGHRDRFATVRNASDYIRNKSPWYDMTHGFHEMAQKTLIRRLAKRMPLSPDMNLAIGLDEQAEAGVRQQLGNALGELLPSSAGGPEQDTVEGELQERLDEQYTPGVDDPDADPNDPRR
jgi:recombination protein RecT